MSKVHWLLGDQLNAGHSWFKQIDPEVCFVLAELRQETDYVTHHIQKVVGFFAAMESFAQALENAGHRVVYLTLDDTRDFEDLTALIEHQCQALKASELHYQLPDEYRLDEQLAALSQRLTIPVVSHDSEHFLTPRDAWERYPNHRMEFFYRALRKEYKVLLDGDGKPEGGQWNYDKDNRESLPATHTLAEPLLFSRDVSALVERLARRGVKTLGSIDAKAFIWPVTRREARQLLNHFLAHCLPNFGRFQDAMTDRGWSLYHSRLAFALNTKMLHPLEVIRAAEEQWRGDPKRITLAQVEGFIRQILGWREYVRALYWRHMPGYRQRNHLGAQRSLPGFYWTGETRMACMAHAIGQSLEHAYAHHIQRLMVTGNFALLAGIHPDDVDAWYLGIYIDAIEWVEMPNTRGMSQYADGGLIASKPYASSGQYIRKMSDYCTGCAYDVKEKTGPGSCPFNSLYWHFIDRHRETLADNPRMKLIYANWDKQDPVQRRKILATARARLDRLEQL
ncbi:cryptochrome/photolyase family protein [Marinimicrobium alkaliphilum]|uniref:cryptochrome/photolyase family protein n=1 Tax=Marinimicrobium alkaliphilum TaxID=2202654 RepID=UPI000DB9770C|nr:cryptochrome/photolyase family protein [Marinimicrobium alkaliphilum]